jgi:hypothetical protein
MSLEPHGATTSQVEVTNVSSHGLWLLAHGRELFLAYEDFPWFKEAPIGSVLSIEEPSPGHFYWPELDVDLGLETIEHPERFPLQSRADA